MYQISYNYFPRVSQKFCNNLVGWRKIWQLWMLCRGHECYEQYWTVRCWALPDTLQMLIPWFASIAGSTVLESSFRLIWPCPIIVVPATRAKFLETSCYSTRINCAFTFHTTNVYDCFHPVQNYKVHRLD